MGEELRKRLASLGVAATLGSLAAFQPSNFSLPTSPPLVSRRTRSHAVAQPLCLSASLHLKRVAGLGIFLARKRANHQLRLRLVVLRLST